MKVFDKILPKLTHLINKGVTVDKLGHDGDSLKSFVTTELEKIEATYGSDQDAAMKLYRTFKDELQAFIDRKKL